MTERSEWLQWRRGGVGASDIAAILGISPWDSPWSIWANKVGLLPDSDESDEMEFGRWAELMIGPWFTERTGLIVTGEQTRLEHPEHPWRRCTVDGFVLEHAEQSIADALGLVQIKTTGPGRRWDEIPPDIQAQEQWEMHVSGKDHAWVPVLMGRRLDIHELARDQADIDYMVEAADRFWTDHVLTGTPPATDGSDATLRALSAVYSEATPGVTVEADDGLLVSVARWRDAKDRRSEAKADEMVEAARIQAVLGDAEELTVNGRRAVSWRNQTRTTTCRACGHQTVSEFRVMRNHPPKETP